MHGRLQSTSLILILVLALMPDIGRAQQALSVPGARGDQLLFFYDTTGGRVSFLVVSNTSSVPMPVEVAWYPQDLSRKLASIPITIAANGNVVLDPATASGVSAETGLAVVTPIRSLDDRTPVVPMPSLDPTTTPATSDDVRPLYGTSTIADTRVGSGLALSPIGRNAIRAGGDFARGGDVVDGDAVRYQRFDVNTLVVPGYFDHRNPDLVSRATLALFGDSYLPAPQGFTLVPRSGEVLASFVGSAGENGATSSFSIDGITSGSLESLAAANLVGSGKATFTIQPSSSGGHNFVGFSSQSLATFAVGGVLPGVGLAASFGTITAGNSLDSGVALRRVARSSRANGPDTQIGQTVTAAVSGTIRRISIAVGKREGLGTEPLTLDIRRMEGADVPGDDRTVLRSISLPATEIQPFAPGSALSFPTFDLGAHGIDVRQGDRFAFSLRTNDPVGYNVAVEQQMSLPDETALIRDRSAGESWSETSGDIVFQVGVQR